MTEAASAGHAAAWQESGLVSRAAGNSPTAAASSPSATDRLAGAAERPRAHRLHNLASHSIGESSTAGLSADASGSQQQQSSMHSIENQQQSSVHSIGYQRQASMHSMWDQQQASMPEAWQARTNASGSQQQLGSMCSKGHEQQAGMPEAGQARTRQVSRHGRDRGRVGLRLPLPDSPAASATLDSERFGFVRLPSFRCAL